MRNLRPGQQFEITLRRDGQEFDVVIRVGGTSYRLSVARGDIISLVEYLQRQLLQAVERV